MQVNNTYLYQVVARACSLSACSVKEAEASLHELEIQPGYCLNLLVSCTYIHSIFNRLQFHNNNSNNNQI